MWWKLCCQLHRDPAAQPLTSLLCWLPLVDDAVDYDDDSLSFVGPSTVNLGQSSPAGTWEACWRPGNAVHRGRSLCGVSAPSCEDSSR